ncbi:MAG: FAD-dependent thymidylate synthase [Prevotellaceae bacterium]|nr:FAD-dependent thymidylate synthase [Candidatus Faecinaster equi]
MEVKILNPEQVKDIFVQWSNFAKVCYDSHPKNPEIIGKKCLESGHFSGSRSQYINFLVTGVPRDTIDQIVRHEQGVCKNVQSFRYVNKSNMTVDIPTEIKDNECLVKRFNNHIASTKELYADIQSYVYDKTGSKERANEQARKILPIHTNSAVAIGFDIEAFIHLCHKRLCVRTEEEHRELVRMMRDAVLEILPELKEYLVPQCQYLLWCPEEKGCGAYKSKKELIEVINNGKGNY